MNGRGVFESEHSSFLFFKISILSVYIEVIDKVGERVYSSI